MLTLLTKQQLSLFPLTCVDDVVSVVQQEVEKKAPSLSLVSVLLGIVERSLTCLPRERSDGVSCVKPERGCDIGGARVTIPGIDIDSVFVLMSKWLVMVLDTGVEPAGFDRCRGTCAQLVKRVSDAVWVALCKQYRTDLPHITSLYSLLVFGKLDCLGVALAVLAACQLLQLDDVTLAISEDHYWCCHGNAEPLHHTEITWHDKDGEDRRGKPVLSDHTEKSWLHSGSHPILCNTHMQISLLVGSMSACLSSGGTSGVLRCTGGVGSSCGGDHSGELLLLQHRLLYQLYSCQHLNQLPMVLGTLADLEMAIYRSFLYSSVGSSSAAEPQGSLESADVGLSDSVSADGNTSTAAAIKSAIGPGHVDEQGELATEASSLSSALKLHLLAVDVSQTLYADRLVVPHLRLGMALLTAGRFVECLEAWSFVSSALAKYNYSRSDEHLYKTLLDIITAHVPRILKENAGLSTISAVFRSLVLLYDGVCAWDEEGGTPLLHVGWAKPMASCLAKFTTSARTSLTFHSADANRHSDTSSVDVSSVQFRSEKMSSLTSILSAPRVNTQAVSLLLAAQSQSIALNRKQSETNDSVTVATQHMARRSSIRSRRD